MSGHSENGSKSNHSIDLDHHNHNEPVAQDSTSESAQLLDHTPDKSAFASYVWMIFIPAFLHYTTEAILIPVLPVFVVEDLGLSDTDAGFATSLNSLVRLVMNIPAGYMISRIGYRYALFIAAIICSVPSLCVGLWPTYKVLLGTRAGFATGSAIFNVGRQAMVSDYVPVEKRGKTMAILGGITRFGSTVSPLISGWIGRRMALSNVFFVQAGLAAVLAVWTLFSTPKPKGSKSQQGSRLGFYYVLSRYWRPLLIMGWFVILLQMLRTGVELMIPLKGISIGLLSDSIGYVISLTSASGLLVFLMGGYISDRWGRKKVAIPGILGLALSAALIGFSTTFELLMATSLFGGLANGFNSGIVLTLGADLAPPESRSSFLGLYSLLSDAGMALGPLVAGYLSDAMGLAEVGYIYAGIGCLGALWMMFVCPETKHCRAA